MFKKYIISLANIQNGTAKVFKVSRLIKINKVVQQNFKLKMLMILESKDIF